MSESEISWNLSEIFPSTTDKSVQAALRSTAEKAESLADKYQGKIGSLPPERVLACIRESEEFFEALRDVVLFARLSFAANMTLPDTQQLFDKVTKLEASLGKTLAFFELEVGRLVYDKPELISDPLFANYRHALEKLRRAVPHQLSEIEEKLIIEKDQFGIQAWQQLQSKWLNTRLFDVEVEGKRKMLSYGEANGLLPHRDRATRESANKSIYSLLGTDGEIFASALRSICNDWVSVCERRKYDSPMHASLIVNDIDQETIDSLVNSVEGHVGVYRRYLKLKARLMGLPKVGCHDLVAPLPDVPDMKFSFEQAREVVTRAYCRFDDEYASCVRDMFAKKHIDASPRFGKRNGAFCAGWFRGKSAFMLQSYNRTLNDVYTLAHELGHATHDYYFERTQTIWNTRIPMVVAETASIFGELLLTDMLLGEAKTDFEKKAIISKVLDGAGMATFQVTARIWFEQSLYEKVKCGEFLDYKTICKLWITSRNRIYDDVVEWFDEMESEWTMKPHYYMANFRFYNYPYVYGQMFVYALYQKFREEGKAFVPKFKQVLSSGGSISPAKIGEIIGLDITDQSFWKLGLEQYERFVDDLEKIAK